MAAVAAVVATGLLVAPTVSRAAPATVHAPSVPTAPQLPTDPQVELAELEERAAKLSEQYRGHLITLEDAKKAAKKATSRLEEVNRELEKARTQVVGLAASRYMNGGLDPALTPLVTGDPDLVLDKAVTAQHIARSTREKLAELETLRDRQKNAQQAAEEQLDGVREEIEDLEKQRGKVEKLMAKFQPESPVTGGASVTSRMANVRVEVDRRFGPFLTIGCYRAGSWGEHPLGRACDFMLASGSLPSPSNVQRGWDAANWATEHASELGIMYVIYRQQIWDIRSGGGWEPMEDRGSITANHYDHVHISVF